MDIYQLRTFVTVAREKTITRASASLFLSQPAVSAHIKAMEDELDLVLFERTPRGMQLTVDGERLLPMAEQTLSAHRNLLAEAKHSKGRLTGRFSLGTARGSINEILGRVLAGLSDAFPDVEIRLSSGSSGEVLQGIRAGRFDAGLFLDEPARHDDLTGLELDRLSVYLAAPPGMVDANTALDWHRLADLPWIFPASSTCCGRVAERTFETYGFRPRKIFHVEHESVTRTLIAGGVGLGFLHSDSASEAQRRNEAVLLGGSRAELRLQFAHLATRAEEPIVRAVMSVLPQLVNKR